MSHVSAVWGCISLLTVSSAVGGLECFLQPDGGTYGMVTQAEPRATTLLNVTAKSTDGHAHRADVRLSATDAFGRALAWTPTLTIDTPVGGEAVTRQVRLPPGPGYYSVWGEIDETGQVRRVWTDVGVVPPPHPGMRKESFFASNTSELRTGTEGEFLRLLGFKVQRAHLPVEVTQWPPDRKPTPDPLPLNFARLDKTLAELAAQESWPLPIIAYALSGAGYNGKSWLAYHTQMYGPPTDRPQFVNTWETILRRYPQLDTYEFWNEPWIFGWTWAGTPQEYRDYQKSWCEMARMVNPRMRLLAGNSVQFWEDNVADHPECWRGLVDGLTHHPYTISVDKATFRRGDTFRAIDYAGLVARREQFDRCYLTEGGTWYKPSLSAPFATLPQAKQPPRENNLENACKIVQYGVRSALSGMFQMNAQWGIGYAPGWTLPNTAVATMTHFLEDRPVVADIWPENELLTGAVFANPRWVTDDVRALPRGAELAARWKVAIPDDRGADPTKVAVIFSQTGPDLERVDGNGTITLDNADETLKAFDLSGRQFQPRGKSLTLPFGEAPVYVVSEVLAVKDLRDRVAHGRIGGVTAVNLYPLSLLEPADRAQILTVRIENQLNVPVEGTLTLEAKGAHGKPIAKFTAPAAQLIEVALPWPGVKPSGENQYAITLRCECRPLGADGKPAGEAFQASSAHLLQVARCTRRTIVVDGDLSDWEGVIPVTLDSRMLKTGFDPTAYLLNPNRAVSGTTNEAHIVTRFYTAYDEGAVYIAAAVTEPDYVCTAGSRVHKGDQDLPYVKAMPGQNGLDHPIDAGDALQIAFGFRDRVAGQGRQMADPWRWKGMFFDTDYQYNLCSANSNALLIRQWGPDMPRRNGYQIDAIPGLEPVPGGLVRIRRDEATHTTIYEAAIPRDELAMFDPDSGRVRFAFVLNNNEKLGALEWARGCGVFDYWLGCGSFAPTWNYTLPCQTFWGIEPPSNRPPAIKALGGVTNVAALPTLDGSLARGMRLSAWRIPQPGQPIAGNPAEPGFDDSTWKAQPLPWDWTRGDLGNDPAHPPAPFADASNWGGAVTGLRSLWFRTRFDCPPDLKDADLMLDLGEIGDRDVTFCNGVEIGRTDSPFASRCYRIPAARVKLQDNVLAVYVRHEAPSGVYSHYHRYWGHQELGWFWPGGIYGHTPLVRSVSALDEPASDSKAWRPLSDDAAAAVSATNADVVIDILPANGQCYATETLTADFRIAIKPARTGILDIVRLETLDLAGVPVAHQDLNELPESNRQISVIFPALGWYRLRAVPMKDGKPLAGLKMGGAYELNYAVFLPHTAGRRPQSPFGICQGNDVNDTAFDAMKAIGARWLRWDVVWDHWEHRKGEYNFDHEQVGAVVKRCKAADIEMLPDFTYCAQWAAHPDVLKSGKQWLFSPPADPAVYAASVKLFAEHFRNDIRVYELWNEPMLSDFLYPVEGMNNEATYAKKIFKPAAAAIKAVDPGIKVFYASQWAEPLGSALGNPELKGLIDGGAIHPYSQDAPEVGRFGGISTYSVRQAGLDAPGWRRTAAGSWYMAPSRSTGVEVWNTETGWFPERSDTNAPDAVRFDRRILATFVPRAYATSLFRGIPHFFFFALSEHAFSRDMRQPNPAAVAYSTTAHFLEDTQPAALVLPRHGLPFYVFRDRRDADRWVVVSWSRGADYFVGIPSDAEAFDLQGNRLDVRNGWARVTRAAIFLRLRQKADTLEPVVDRLARLRICGAAGGADIGRWMDQAEAKAWADRIVERLPGQPK